MVVVHNNNRAGSPPEVADVSNLSTMRKSDAPVISLTASAQDCLCRDFAAAGNFASVSIDAGSFAATSIDAVTGAAFRYDFAAKPCPPPAALPPSTYCPQLRRQLCRHRNLCRQDCAVAGSFDGHHAASFAAGGYPIQQPEWLGTIEPTELTG
eukprot:gene10018-biopygen4320